ncbi:MAG: LPP20 family lipoprotein [Spirochaetia bacterium]|nr:LPP20 family lipoprotein [Spirochaetia bacterium]
MTMKGKKRLLLLDMVLSCLVLLGGCASVSNSNHKELPSWVSDTYDGHYPKKDYVCAVGSGTTKEQAQHHAMDALAQTFSSDVVVTQQAMDYDDTVAATSSLMELSTIESTLEGVEGVEVSNLFADAAGTFWVRVVLDRKQAASAIRSQVSEAQKNILSLESKALAATSPFDAYRGLRSALLQASKIQPKVLMLGVLDQTTTVSPVSQVEAMVNAIKPQLILDLKVEGPDSKVSQKLDTAVRQVLLDEGLTVRKGAAALLSISYQGSFSDKASSGFYLCNYALQASLTDRDTQVLSYADSGRGAGITQEVAAQKALQVAMAKLQKGLFAVDEP